jgi:hypothetical protein
MMQTTAAFATLSVQTPMVLLYIDSVDSVMITYTKELHYGVFNNQSCAKSDFSLVNRRGSNENSTHSIYGPKKLSFGHFFGSDN